MTRIYQEAFNGGADNVQITTANTTFTTLGSTTGTRVFDTGVVKEGSASAELTCTAQVVYLSRVITATNRVYLRFYIRPDSSVGSGRPSSNLVIAKFHHGATVQTAQLVYNTTGNLKIQNNASVIIGANTATALPVDEWSRIEVAIDGANCLLRVYPGNAQVDAAGTPAVAGDSQSGAHGIGATPGVNDVWVGVLGSTTVKLRLDALDTDDATWVGPLPAAPTSLPLAAASTDGAVTGTSALAALSDTDDATLVRLTSGQVLDGILQPIEKPASTFVVTLRGLSENAGTLSASLVYGGSTLATVTGVAPGGTVGDTVVTFPATSIDTEVTEAQWRSGLLHLVLTIA